jgi:DNA replication protein DnaC
MQSIRTWQNSSPPSPTPATAAEPSPPTEASIRLGRNKCDQCHFGLLDPPAIKNAIWMVDERTAQYEAGLLRFCDCALGQGAARFYAQRSANPYGQQLAAEAAQRRQSYLLGIDGLKPDERKMTLSAYKVARHNRAAVEAVSAGIEKGAGLITLTGEFGVGKTALLMAAVNECRAKDWTAIYITVADLLAWLREGFSPHAERDQEDNLSYEKRWRLLVNCQCLCLDELTAFSVTPWAQERFERLIDERWRSMSDKLTVCALNGEAERQPAARPPGQIHPDRRRGHAPRLPWRHQRR